LLNAPEAEPARRYLRERGIEDSSVRRFRLGFSPDHWQWVRDRATSASIPPALLEAIDLVSRSSTSGRQYERFKGRLIFPIRDTQNRPIAFGGRILPEFADDKTAKYVNSSETRLFSKSQHLYGLNVVRDAVAKKRHALVVEGYTDAIVAFQHGVDNVVAVLGTALGAGHIRLLRRFADVVTLVLDGDEAGQRRTNEVLELFVASQLDLRIVTLPGGLDPCDFLMQQGLEEFERRIAQAPDALDHKIHIATHGVDLSRDTHRANQALEEILTTLAKSPSGGGDAGQSRLRQQQVLSRLSREFRVDEAELRLRLRSMRRAPKSFGRAETTAREEEPGLDSWERSLFELLTQRPELAAAATQSIPVSELQSRAARALWELYVSFCHQNEVPEFGRVLTALDNPTWKNLLVEVDESGQSKSFDDAEQHLQGLIAAFERRAHERQTRDVISTLESNKLSEEEQLSVLHELIDRQRRKHDQA
jgi:DNA primase